MTRIAAYDVSAGKNVYFSNWEEFLNSLNLCDSKFSFKKVRSRISDKQQEQKNTFKTQKI